MGEDEAPPGHGSPPHDAREKSDETYMVGDSPPVRKAFALIRKFATTDAPVLISGESGTGKELAALAIHERSSHRTGPFAPINCAGLPPTLIGSELFGHERGAFTGAYQRHIGKIEAAQGGTVFLDEIGDLPLDLQAHLLRFLQEKTVDRIGGRRPIPVDVRIIAATHEDLETAVADGRFRKDLFYRLNVLLLDLPPLRERGDDIKLLATYFLRRIAKELERPSVRGFDRDAIGALRTHDWPGNVRELISAVRRTVLMTENEWITARDLGLGDGSTPTSDSERPLAFQFWANARTGIPAPINDFPSLEKAKMEFEEAFVREALHHFDYNVKHTAEKLHVSRVTLHRLIRKYGIQRDLHPTSEH